MSAEFYVIGTLGQSVQGRVATITGQFPTANRFGRIVRNNPFAVSVMLTDEGASALQGQDSGMGVVIRGRVIPKDDKPANALLLASHVDVTGPQSTVTSGDLNYGEWGHLGATLSAEVVTVPQVHDFGHGTLRVSFLAAYNTRGNTVLVVSEGAGASVHAQLTLGDRVNLSGTLAEDTTVDPLGRPLTTLNFVVGRQDQESAQTFRARSAAPRGQRERVQSPRGKVRPESEPQPAQTRQKSKVNAGAGTAKGGTGPRQASQTPVAQVRKAQPPVERGVKAPVAPSPFGHGSATNGAVHTAPAEAVLPKAAAFEPTNEIFNNLEVPETPALQTAQEA